MKFYYSIDEMVREEIEPSGSYWTAEEIRQIHLYPEGDPELARLEAEDHSIWPVHDAGNGGFSWEPTECKDADEAYEYLLGAKNQSLYEYYYDL